MLQCALIEHLCMDPYSYTLQPTEYVCACMLNEVAIPLKGHTKNGHAWVHAHVPPNSTNEQAFILQLG